MVIWCRTYGKGRNEGNVWFNDALNTFLSTVFIWWQTSGKRPDSERGNLLLPARVLLYASSHRQDNTYHSLCYTSHGAVAGMRNRSMGSPWRIDPTTHHTMSKRSYHGATSRSQHMIKDNIDSERENPLLPHHKLLFLIRSKGSSICTIPHQDGTYHSLCFIS